VTGRRPCRPGAARAGPGRPERGRTQGWPWPRITRSWREPPHPGGESPFLGNSCEQTGRAQNTVTGVAGTASPGCEVTRVFCNLHGYGPRARARRRFFPKPRSAAYPSIGRSELQGRSEHGRAALQVAQNFGGCFRSANLRASIRTGA